MNHARALFLDRDGVINLNHGYVHTREHFDFVDGIFDVCHKAKRWEYLLIVVTNQAGIGRGYFSEEDFHRLTDWMLEQFRHRDAGISKVYFCPYHPEHGIGEYKRESPCRKPNPGMLLAAASDFDLDLAACVLVGDKASDVEAGRTAGVGCNVLYVPGSTPSLIGPTIGHLAELEEFLRPPTLPEGTPRDAA